MQDVAGAYHKLIACSWVPILQVGGLGKVRVDCFPKAITTWLGRESNPRPPDPESDALTTLPRCPIIVCRPNETEIDNCVTPTGYSHYFGLYNRDCAHNSLILGHGHERYQQTLDMRHRDMIIPFIYLAQRSLKLVVT